MPFECLYSRTGWYILGNRYNLGTYHLPYPLYPKTASSLVA